MPLAVSRSRARVKDVWLIPPAARVMLVKVMRVGGTFEYSDYRKFSVQTDTKIGKPQ